MINLSNVTLICIDPVDPIGASKVLKYCEKGIKFADTVLVSTACPFDFCKTFYTCPHTDWQKYNDLVLHMIQYVKTDFALLVQTDGFILNPDLFDTQWFDYDYIGAPWPGDPEWIRLQTPRLQKTYSQDTRVGNGGFSWRSRKFMTLSNNFESTNGLGEDTFLCVENYRYMIDNGINFAPVIHALKFSIENPIEEIGINWRDTQNPSFNANNSFGWHGKQISNFQELMGLSNVL